MSLKGVYSSTVDRME